MSIGSEALTSATWDLQGFRRQQEGGQGFWLQGLGDLGEFTCRKHLVDRIVALVGASAGGGTKGQFYIGDKERGCRWRSPTLSLRASPVPGQFD